MMSRSRAPNRRSLGRDTLVSEVFPDFSSFRKAAKLYESRLMFSCFAALSCGEKSRQEKNQGKALGPG